MHFYPMRPPEEWATGGERMTEKQKALLREVAREHGVNVPFLSRFNANSQQVTKAEAYMLTEMLKDGVIPDEQYMSTLGRRRPHHSTAPPHPRLWRKRNARRSKWQWVWIQVLLNDIGVPKWVREEELGAITRGQAALLIGILRDEREWLRMAEDVAMELKSCMQDVREQLPDPVRRAGLQRESSVDWDSERSSVGRD